MGKTIFVSHLNMKVTSCWDMPHAEGTMDQIQTIPAKDLFTHVEVEIVHGFLRSNPQTFCMMLTSCRLKKTRNQITSIACLTK